MNAAHNISPAELAGMIDHTLLKSDATRAKILALCGEAREQGFAAVCVNPVWVEEALDALGGSGVAVATVAGFPLGASTTATKVAEARQAMQAGATEIDVVQNIGWACEGRFDAVRDELGEMVQALEGRAMLKVIIECCLLSDEQKRLSCRAAVEAGAGYVKTSTGFAACGATADDVRLMRETVAPAVGVKAAGGIGDYATAVAMIRAGATRIGASRSLAILAGASAAARTTTSDGSVSNA
jgi:deoxyribose-phosphate aldolase